MFQWCNALFISIFELNMLVKIGVIFMPFSNPTCHFRATADFTVCTVCWNSTIRSNLFSMLLPSLRKMWLQKSCGNMGPLCLTNWLEPLFSAKLPPKLVQHVSFGWIQFIHQIPLFIPWIWPSSSILNYGIFLFVKYLCLFTQKSNIE